MKPLAADVARYLVEKYGAMSQLKLQKLLYYCQAGSLAWRRAPMFLDEIQAWANGPVVVSFWNSHRYEGWISAVPEGGQLVEPDDRRIADAIYSHYGKLSPETLSDLTHRELPWKNARRNLQPGQRGSAEIRVAEMLDFYPTAWAR